MPYIASLHIQFFSFKPGFMKSCSGRLVCMRGCMYSWHTLNCICISMFIMVIMCTLCGGEEGLSKKNTICMLEMFI